MLIEWVRRSLSPSWIFSKATSKSPWLLGHQRFLSLWLLTTFCNIRSWPLGCETHQLCCQRLMQEVLSGVTDCEAYLDDIVIYSSIWTDHGWKDELSVWLVGCCQSYSKPGQVWFLQRPLLPIWAERLARARLCRRNNCCRVPHSHNKKRAA